MPAAKKKNPTKKLAKVTRPPARRKAVPKSVKKQAPQRRIPTPKKESPSMTDESTTTTSKPKAKAKASEEEATPLTDEALGKEGDAEEGHYSVEELAEQIRPRLITARDRRAYLTEQAEKNEAANDEVNEAETDLINEGRDRLAVFLDPDKMREENLGSALADIKMHTDEGREDRAKSRQEIANARKERGDVSPVPGDISGGSGGGDRPENRG